jgi:ADP-ribose pyrophosphatase
MVRPWRTLESEHLGDYAVFQLRRDRNESQATGAARDFYVIEAPAWINIIPVTPEGKVVLIRQYRHGTRAHAESGDPEQPDSHIPGP